MFSSLDVLSLWSFAAPRVADVEFLLFWGACAALRGSGRPVMDAQGVTVRIRPLWVARILILECRQALVRSPVGFEYLLLVSSGTSCLWTSSSLRAICFVKG